MQKDIKNFQKTVWQYHKKNRRDFPWRKTHNPYHILVSEIMLQQTQTNRVVPKYIEFLKRFPALEKLACAPLRDVLHLWQGLGYNRRAKFLHECAKELCEKYNSKFPRELTLLKKLPGIGQSTAGAILNFAFNIPTPFIETNIRTVFIHHFFNDNKEKVTEKDLLKLINETLPRPVRHRLNRQAMTGREWFYALYDYGSFLKSTLSRDPAKKSSLYKKQSAFKGSFREKRSYLLRHIINKNVSEKDAGKIIQEKFNSTDSQKVLESLVKDGLIVRNKKHYSVK